MKTLPTELRMQLIVPCYNEEENIPLFVAAAEGYLSAYDWQILFVNDGSKDASWSVIVEQSKKNPRVNGLCFARNFGHQNALKAGLEELLNRSVDLLENKAIRNPILRKNIDNSKQLIYG